MPRLADTFSIFELWVRDADGFGGSCERMETLHLGLSSESENGSTVSNCPDIGFPGRLERHCAVYDLDHSDSRIAKTIRRSFLGKRLNGGVSG